MEAWDHEPEQPQDCCRDGYEPEPCQLDPAGRALSIIPGGDYSYEGALHRDGSDLYRAAADHLAKLTHYVEWTTWDEYHGMEKHLLRAAVFFLRRWRLEHRVMWPAQLAATLVLAMLLTLLAALAATRAATRPPPPDLTPAAAYVRSRTVLTAAPPRPRAPVLAGAAA